MGRNTEPGSEHAEKLLAAARRALAKGDTDGARCLYEEAVAADEASLDGWLEMGMVRYLTQDYEAVLAVKDVVDHCVDEAARASLPGRTKGMLEELSAMAARVAAALALGTLVTMGCKEAPKPPAAPIASSSGITSEVDAITPPEPSSSDTSAPLSAPTPDAGVEGKVIGTSQVGAEVVDGSTTAEESTTKPEAKPVAKPEAKPETKPIKYKNRYIAVKFKD